MQLTIEGKRLQHLRWMGAPAVARAADHVVVTVRVSSFIAPRPEIRLADLR